MSFFALFDSSAPPPVYPHGDLARKFISEKILNERGVSIQVTTDYQLVRAAILDWLGSREHKNLAVLTTSFEGKHIVIQSQAAVEKVRSLDLEEFLDYDDLIFLDIQTKDFQWTELDRLKNAVQVSENASTR